MKRDIHVAHSPDSDDAFMFYALATRKIDTGELNYIHLLSDIETLNRKALEGQFEVSAVSFHAYAHMADKYALLSCGASIGRNYGPVVVSGKPMRAESLVNRTVAIPGTLTTAFLVLRLKRDLGKTLMNRVALDIRKSIQYGLDHREEALAYALHFARGMDPQRVDRFIGMYVNELTLDYGAEGQEAVRRLLDEAYSKNLIPKPVALEFV